MIIVCQYLRNILLNCISNTSISLSKKVLKFHMVMYNITQFNHSLQYIRGGFKHKFIIQTQIRIRKTKTKSMQFITRHRPSFVCGSDCHYTREFLLYRISQVPSSSFGEGEELKQCTLYDPISASRVRTAVNLNALEEMKIIELLPGGIHNNKVIYATVIDNGFSMTAYHTVVEDNYGQCAKLCIYNTTPILLDFLKKDTKIAIVNPYYKKGGNDHLYFIRQESPDEVIVMLDKPTVNCKNEKTESKSCDDYKAEGNGYFKSEK